MVFHKVVKHDRIGAFEHFYHVVHREDDFMYRVVGLFRQCAHALFVALQMRADKTLHKSVFVLKKLIYGFFADAQVAGNVVHGDALYAETEEELFGSF